jgi:uncharacterized protein (TIGR02001 family)
MIRTASVVAACILLAPRAVAAQPSWGGSVTLASNHLLRGISRSSNDPSLSTEIHVQGPQGWFAGMWAATSRLRPADDTAVEVAATAGWGGTLGARWHWRGSYSHYESPWRTDTSSYRYNEFTLDLQLRDALLLSVSWSPDRSVYSPYFGPLPRRERFAYELSFQHPLPAGLRVHAGAGYEDLAEHLDDGYWYGSAGIGWTWRRWHSDLSYVHPGRAARNYAWPGTARRRAQLQLSYFFRTTP